MAEKKAQKSTYRDRLNDWGAGSVTIVAPNGKTVVGAGAKKSAPKKSAPKK